MSARRPEGLGALSALIGALPSRPGLALVVVQHLDPRQESRLADLLRRQTSMTVVDAAHGSKVLPDHVYVIKPNTDVAIADGVLSVTPRPEERRPHYPVDHFFRSLAQVQGPHAVGVVLSGTGSDGMLGVCEIKAAGGVTFAQDEQTAQHAGMPHNAVASGAVDLVLPPEEIAAHLATLPEHPYLAAAVADEPKSPDDTQQFQQVVAALRNSSGVDFSQYRDTTIKRRTARRMLLRGFKSPVDYARFIERDRSEAEALYRDVLINVTSFFRDPEMFEDLKRDVFPEIVKAKGEDGLDPRLGARVLDRPGGVLDRHGADRVPRREATARTIQIFATDLGDPATLDKARAGVYPESIEGEVSPERLKRFFTKKDGCYRVQKSIREQVVFARQNITVDPPFSRVDLHHLPQCPDLHVSGASASAAAGLSFRLECEWIPRARPRRNGRPVQRSLRVDQPASQNLPKEDDVISAATVIRGRRVALRRLGPAPESRTAAFVRCPAGSRASSPRSLCAAKRARQPGLRDSGVPRPNRAVSRNACQDSRPRTFCAWPGMGCSSTFASP